jgi:hypothetical protein
VGTEEEKVFFGFFYPLFDPLHHCPYVKGMVVIGVDLYDGEVQAKPFIDPFKFIKGRAGGGFAVLGIHRKEHKGFCTLFYGLPYRSLYKGLPISHGRLYNEILGQNFLQGFCLGFCLLPLRRFASHQLVVVFCLFCPKEGYKEGYRFLDESWYFYDVVVRK